MTWDRSSYRRWDEHHWGNPVGQQMAPCCEMVVFDVFSLLFFLFSVPFSFFLFSLLSPLLFSPLFFFFSFLLCLLSSLLLSPRFFPLFFYLLSSLLSSFLLCLLSSLLSSIMVDWLFSGDLAIIYMRCNYKNGDIIHTWYTSIIVGLWFVEDCRGFCEDCRGFHCPLYLGMFIIHY